MLGLAVGVTGALRLPLLNSERTVVSHFILTSHKSHTRVLLLKLFSNGSTLQNLCTWSNAAMNSLRATQIEAGREQITSGTGRHRKLK